MLAKTHIVGGLAAGFGYAAIAEVEPAVVVVAAVCGSLLPDIDHAKSTITRSNPLFRLISAGINLIFTHRTFTHSLVFLALIAWGLSALGIPEIVKIGFLLGIVSHLALDAFTTQGIKLFYPMKTRFRFPLYVKTGGWGENIFTTILVALSVYWLISG